ncbi:MAG: hypothetical protein ACI8PT_003116 [Gammaproteobacteria bacterium]|jgi:hypothetical protein
MLSLGSYFVLGVIWSAMHQPITMALLASATQTFLGCAMVVIALSVQGFRARTTQTLSAMTGTGVVLNTVAMPLNIAIVAIQSNNGDASALILASLVILLWSLSITAHIFRHALDTGFGTGLALAVVMFVILVTIMRAFFPAPEVPTAIGG